jgi:hypothetical protein
VWAWDSDENSVSFRRPKARVLPLPGVYFSSPDAADEAVSSTSRHSLRIEASNQRAAGHFTIRTNISAQIRAVSNDTSTTLAIGTRGWTDPRGKDA